MFICGLYEEGGAGNGLYCGYKTVVVLSHVWLTGVQKMYTLEHKVLEPRNYLLEGVSTSCSVRIHVGTYTETLVFHFFDFFLHYHVIFH